MPTTEHFFHEGPRLGQAANIHPCPRFTSIMVIKDPFFVTNDDIV